VYRYAVQLLVIRTFRHRGLRRLHEHGDPSKLSADQAERIGIALADLHAATRPQDLDLPGYRLHPLKGTLKGFWSLRISANWRIIFRFDGVDAFDVDLVDYH
jgi:proteic killer suppression protein